MHTVLLHACIIINAFMIFLRHTFLICYNTGRYNYLFSKFIIEVIYTSKLHLYTLCVNYNIYKYNYSIDFLCTHDILYNTFYLLIKLLILCSQESVTSRYIRCFLVVGKSFTITSNKKCKYFTAIILIIHFNTILVKILMKIN